MSRNPILQLAESVANQIAAGEVVARPSSVVKELVENSIDAGAARITVRLQRGGLELIQVDDDGEGIPGDQVALAFERHATSKIRAASDLAQIASLGFRGEAMPSIASVSHVTLRTKVRGARSGTEIRLEGGKRVALEPAGTPEGTSITVARLFYNTPARRKFLKTEAAERRHCIDIVSRLALAHPQIQFVVEAEGRETLRTSGDGSLRSTMSAIYDSQLARALIEVQSVTGFGTVSGLIAPPAQAKGNRQHLTLLVNGRWIQSHALAIAVEKGYEALLPARRFPVGVIHLSIEPSLIDVNVHPGKTEVRIRDEREVFKAVLDAVRKALLQANLIPGQTARMPYAAESAASTEPEAFPTTVELFRPKERPRNEEEVPITWHPASDTPAPEKRYELVDPTTGEVRERNPAPALSQSTYAEPVAVPEQRVTEGVAEDEFTVAVNSPTPESRVVGTAKAAEHWREPLRNTSPEHMFPTGPADAATARQALRQATVVGQVLNTYMLLPVPWGLWLVDQHVAHERILFEEVLGKSGRPPDVQQLLVPITVDLPAAAAAQMDELITALERIGFQAEDFGGRSLLVRGIPASLSRRTAAVHEILQEMASMSPEAYTEARNETSAALVACKGAVKAGERLAPETMHELVRRLADVHNPFACPHGRPVIIEIGQAELERRFLRR